MNTLILIIFWLGIFTLFYVAVKLFLVVLVFIFAIPVAIYDYFKEKKLNKRREAEMRIVGEKIAKAIQEHNEEAAKNAAYNSAVEKASTVKPKTKRKPVVRKTTKK